MSERTEFYTLVTAAVSRYAAEAKYIPRYISRRRWVRPFQRWYELVLRLNDCRIDFFNYLLSRMRINKTVVNHQQIVSRAPYFEFLHSRLEDEAEKQLLLKVFAIRIMCLADLEVDVSEFNWLNIKPSPESRQNSLYLPRVNELSVRDYKKKLTMPVNVAHVFKNAPNIVLNSTDCLYEMFLYGQYNHRVVHPDKGDVCIDCGAFMGETTIWMAALVGDSGHCYSVEMMPDNVKHIGRSINLNPTLSSQIDIIRSPLASVDGMEVGLEGMGSEARVLFGDDAKKCSYRSKTMTIDLMVQKHNICKVNFIKMDVEGSEYDILQGCVETLRRFRPKLAIAIYHDDRDFVRIPLFVDSLDLGYKFYLGHHNHCWTETVLYACCTPR